MAKNRLIYSILFLLSFLILAFYAFDMEINYGDKYAAQVLSNIIETDYSQTERGKFLDSNGVILADSVTYYEVFLKNEYFNQISIDKLAADLQNYNSELSVNFANKIKSFDLTASDRLVVGDLDENGLAQNKDLFEKFNNFDVKKKYRRIYKFPNQFAHIIGYTGIPTKQELGDYYSADDSIGKYRLEASLEEDLRGVKEKKYQIEGVDVLQDGIKGNDVYLTIDSKWQNALYNILIKHQNLNGANASAGVIVDIETGDIKAMASYPSFDSNAFVAGISDEEYQGLINDFRQPLVDKTISLSAAPGSTFKLITAYDLLENGIVNEDTGYFSNRCIDLGGGANFCEFGKLFYGQMNIIRAIYMSSNLFFCNFSLEQESQGNIAKLIESAKIFGLSTKTGVNLDGEVEGYLPDINTSNGWFSGDTCNTAIGQGGVAATPLQMALVPMAIENKGKVLKPNVIEKIVDSEGNVISEPEPEILREINISDHSRDIIESGMNSVIRNPESVLYWIFRNVPNDIKAKTGTAETSQIKNGTLVEDVHGWIIGIFDYQGKKYSFAFHLNHGGGGYYASFILKDFMDCLNSNFTAEVCEKQQ